MVNDLPFFIGYPTVFDVIKYCLTLIIYNECFITLVAFS